MSETPQPAVRIARAEFKKKLRFLFEPHPLKVLYGGRGGIKSWSIAQALLTMGSERQLRILCARELMKSIAESVHHLLEMQIERLGFAGDYRIEKSHIYGPHGTEFAFTGLRDSHNLKSFESFDICWVEEAANVTKRSWDMLLPTIRKAGSEVWISFNPELDSDETYKRFVLKPPPGAVVVKTSYHDNNWLTPELQRQIDHMRETAPDDFLNIYEGHPKVVLDGAIYAHELRALAQAGRIRSVPYDPALPVHTFWDLGIADQTSIWFVQAGLFEYRFIDFLQDRNRALPYYLAELQKRGYVYGFHHLPHDGNRRDLGTGKSIENLMTTAGFKVKIVPQIGVANGLNAARNLFTKAYFDEVKCADGLNCLRRYRWKLDPDTGIYSKEPLHDDNCFTPDGLVLTRHGMRRIMDLPENGEVLTPCGWRAYRRLGITRRNAPLVEVRFTDGFSVRCTPEHLFLADDGWRSAESLAPGTLIRSCLTPSRSISMAASIVCGRVKGIFSAVASRCIAPLGSLHSARFRRAATFITATATPQTTLSAISNAFPSTSTFQLPGTRNVQSEPFLKRRGTRRPSGIAPKRAGCGTSGKPSAARRGLFGSALKSLAITAAIFTTRWFATAGTRSGSVARCAKPLRIASALRLSETADVTCIRVEDGHWFSLGNGAVVHNSNGADAYRMAAVGLTQPAREKQARSREMRAQMSTWS